MSPSTLSQSTQAFTSHAILDAIGRAIADPRVCLQSISGVRAVALCASNVLVRVPICVRICAPLLSERGHLPGDERRGGRVLPRAAQAEAEGQRGAGARGGVQRATAEHTAVPQVPGEPNGRPLPRVPGAAAVRALRADAIQRRDARRANRQEALPRRLVPGRPRLRRAHRARQPAPTAQVAAGEGVRATFIYCALYSFYLSLRIRPNRKKLQH